MLFNEFLFMVMAMFGHVNAGSNVVPSCDPPAPICSIWERSVCEWSDSGKPVWACRGFFEKINHGPKRPQPEPTSDDGDVIIGTGEYKIPQGSGKSQSPNGFESDDVEFVTYTYPIGKDTKQTASKVESEPEVKIGTFTLPVSPRKSSSASRVVSGSETGSIAGSRGIEPNSDSKVKNLTYQLPSAKKGGSKVGTGSDVQLGTLPLTSGESNGDSDSGEVYYIETYTIRVPKNKKSSGLPVESVSGVHIGTYTSPVPDNYKVEHAEENSETQVGTYEIPSSKTAASQNNSETELQVGTHTLPVSSVKSSSPTKMDSESEAQVKTHTLSLVKSNSGEAASVESDSDVQSVTYTDQVPSSKKNSSSQVMSDDSAQMGTNTTSSKNSSGTVLSDSKTSTQIGTYTVPPVKTTSRSIDSESESDIQLGTYKVSSGRARGSSDDADPESNIQIRTYKIASGKGAVTKADDSESKLLAAAYSNQADMKTPETESHAASGIETGTASTMSRASSRTDAESGIGIHEVPVSSGSSDSQSEDQTRTNANAVHLGAENSGVQPGSDSNGQLTPQSSSSVLNADSEAPLRVETGRNDDTHGDNLEGTGVMADGAVQINQTSAIQGLQRSSSSLADAVALRPVRQGPQATGVGQTNLGRGQYGSSSNGASNQQYISGFPTAYRAQPYHSQNSGNAGPVPAAGIYHHTGDSQYFSDERTLPRNLGNVGATHAAGNQMAEGYTSSSLVYPHWRTLSGGYSTGSSSGSQTNENQAYYVGSIMPSYHPSSEKGSAIRGGPYYQANTATGSGSVNQNYVTGTTNRQPSGYPYGYRSLDQGSVSASPNQLARSGYGIYLWPHIWTPAVNVRPRVYGSNWLVGPNALLINPAFIGFAPQNMAQSDNAGLYSSRSMNSFPESTATSNTSFHQSLCACLSPFAQDFSNKGLGTTDSTVCSFCKKLMAIVGGANICNLLEPIILEFFNKVLEIFTQEIKVDSS